MLIQRHCPSARTLSSPSLLASSLRSLTLRDTQTPRNPVLISVRHATHGAQGRANGPKNGPGKRLGAKKTGDQEVVAGNIIFRQRGTNWYPGENCGMGRDHTIFALEAGFVKYYRNPGLHPKRRYIGVVFEKAQTLPTPLNAARRRRLNMVAVPRMGVEGAREGGEVEVGSLGIGSAMGNGVEDADAQGRADVGASGGVAAGTDGSDFMAVQSARGDTKTKRQIREAQRERATGRVPDSELQMRPGYMYRESNYQIGQAAERAGVQVKMFQRGDRFLAWRKKNARKARNAERRALGGSKKGAQKKGGKK